MSFVNCLNLSYSLFTCLVSFDLGYKSLLDSDALDHSGFDHPSNHLLPPDHEEVPSVQDPVDTLNRTEEALSIEVF
jgi:hypothetical protein